MKRKHYLKNPVFIIAAVKMIFKKNYGVSIDKDEVDTSITIGENISEIKQNRHINIYTKAYLK